ncbi:MAG: sterol desaturase/sphingolipid hydroxylase (fatty acid hydroxylase superfamily) [Thermoproteota archaeon]|jgi:sterol desaturase/sphingolipid hydroxylase (fatty acid hydroxylase superfamily)
MSNPYTPPFKITFITYLVVNSYRIKGLKQSGIMNTTDIIYFLLPLLAIFMAAEFYFLNKAGEVPNKKEYVANIINAFGSFLVDALVLQFIFMMYKYFFKFSLYQFPDQLSTYIFAVVTIDFVLYWSHRLGHTVPFLWAIHSVHHQGDDYNLSKGFRQPWLHKFYAISFYLVLALMGIPLEVLTVSYSFNILAQFWVHTKFMKKELRFMYKVFMTPAQHRVHHGQNALYIDKNFGLAFSIWDHIFGTYQAETEEVIYGVNDDMVSDNPLWTNLYPLVKLVSNSIVAIKERSFLRYLFGLKKIKSSFSDPYKKLESIGNNDRKLNRHFYSFSYVTSQFIFLMYLSLQAIHGNLVQFKYILIPFILFSFGVLGTLYDLKKIGKTLEPIRLVSTLLIVSQLDNLSGIAFLGIHLLVSIPLLLTDNKGLDEKVSN